VIDGTNLHQSIRGLDSYQFQIVLAIVLNRYDLTSWLRSKGLDRLRGTREGDILLKRFCRDLRKQQQSAPNDKCRPAWERRKEIEHAAMDQITEDLFRTKKNSPFAG
jgi:hypothetical protein